MHSSFKKTIIWLVIPQTLLLVLTAVLGLFTPNFYHAELLNWRVQCIAQDIINLFVITPVLVIAALLAAKNNVRGLWMWGGVNLYLIYTFIIYCFNVHFNQAFIVYCAVLGLSFYSIIQFMLVVIKLPVQFNTARHSIKRFIAIGFITISVVFYFLWLAEIIPASLSGTVPDTLNAHGLVTNPVQVLDLSVVLPGFFITGLLILKGRFAGEIMTGPMLVFSILMSLTIMIISITGLAYNMPLNMYLVGAMALLIAFGKISFWYHSASLIQLPQ